MHVRGALTTFKPALINLSLAIRCRCQFSSISGAKGVTLTLCRFSNPLLILRLRKYLFYLTKNIWRFEKRRCYKDAF